MWSTPWKKTRVFATFIKGRVTPKCGQIHGKTRPKCGQIHGKTRVFLYSYQRVPPRCNPNPNDLKVQTFLTESNGIGNPPGSPPGPNMAQRRRVHLSPGTRAPMNTPFSAQHRLNIGSRLFFESPTWCNMGPKTRVFGYFYQRVPSRCGQIHGKNTCFFYFNQRAFDGSIAQ